MTTAPVQPEVALRFHPTDLDPETLRAALAKPFGSPSEAIEAGLMTARLMVIAGAKAEVAKMTGDLSAAKLIGAVDLVWQIYAPRFVRSLGPAFAEEYLRVMKAAGAGEIPMSTVYALAEQHASRLGAYYHESSRDALAQGFNTFVNRRMAERVAADRVLDGYGLTSRGMAGLTSRALDKAETVTELTLKQRVLDYIGTSVRKRSKVFATQEEHNISQQAQQIAWMWLMDNGKISPNSQKMWLTARDEKVCPECGPMHGKKVMLGDRFVLPNGTEVWVPGVHPNCRCELRLMTHPWLGEAKKSFSKAGWNPKEHPRGGDPLNPGRFSAKARTSKPKPVREAERDEFNIQSFLDQAALNLEEEQAQETAEETMERLLPKTRISQTQKTRISQAQKTHISQAARTFIGEKTQIGQQVKQTILQSPMRTRVAGQPTAKTGVFAPPADRTRLEADTAKTFLAMQQELKKPRPQPQPTPYEVVPTLRLERPVYTIGLDPWMIDEDGYVEMTSETEFQPMNEIEATRRATEDFDENGWAVVDDITYNDRNRITQEMEDGTTLIGVVDQDHVTDVVMYAAWQGKTDDPDMQGDAQVPVNWYKADEYGEPSGDLVYGSRERVAEISEEWGLEPSHFEIPVFVLDEGHNSELGETVMMNAETRHGFESWVTTGRYRIEPMNRQQVGSSVPIQFYRLVPDVENRTRQVKPPGFGEVPPEMSDEDLSDFDRGD